ncbi:MAG: CoA transferase [Gammaproteobacteria bacterium]|nr:CoA transferase [Gammaproteobacteria bacterium]
MGPLHGIKIVELAGIGPGPMCAMLLSDMGAQVLRVDRVEPSGLGMKRDPKFDLMNRGRRSVAVNIKTDAGRETVLRLIEQSDALIEGFRPGVMERLGLGPEVCQARCQRLVYGRMTGWGQAGPIAHAAGHDINYIALTGALHAVGQKNGPPVVPLNLFGDFGGGALYLAFGIACGIIEARTSGQGQVVDAAMTDGSASLMTMFYGMLASGTWQDSRGSNAIDGGSHFYTVYETKDGQHVSIGSIEAKFYAELLQLTGLDTRDLPEQFDASRWDELRALLAQTFKTKTRDEWVEIIEGSDVCFAPVLSLAEAPNHPHNRARSTFVEIDGVVQPAPAPRFSRTVPSIQRPPATPGQHTDEALRDWGFSAQELARLHEKGAIA